MDSKGKERAGMALSAAMAAKHLTAVDLAEMADIPDPATIREFAAGERWARTSTRGKIEAALGWQAGHLERIARGALADHEVEEDEVIGALRRSTLSRADQAELVAHYYRLLDANPSSRSAV